MLYLEALLAPIGGFLPRIDTSSERDVQRLVNLNYIRTGVMLFCVTKKIFPESRGSSGVERISNLFSDIEPITYSAYSDFAMDKSGFPDRYDFRSDTSYSGVLEVQLETSDWSKDTTRLQQYIKEIGSLAECTGSRYCIAVSCEEDLKN